jgi:hypothetical protein
MVMLINNKRYILQWDRSSLRGKRRRREIYISKITIK